MKKRNSKCSLILVLALSALATACAKTSLDMNSAGKDVCSAVNSLPEPTAPSCTDQNSCPALSGTSWVPSVAGVSPANHSASVSSTKTVITKQGVPITGLAQAAPASREVTVTIDMSQDLGGQGSLTLEAAVRNFPSSLTG